MSDPAGDTRDQAVRTRSWRVLLDDRRQTQRHDAGRCLRGVGSGMSANVADSFGILLRSHRLAASMTQEMLAARAGISKRTVRALEHGAHRPYRETARRLAAALGLTGAERETLLTAADSAPRRPNEALSGGTEYLQSLETRLRRPTLRQKPPLALNEFIGRPTVDRVADLLQRARLLTITGPGGVGKTRLAQEVATSLESRFDDGVWFLELAALPDPALVPHAAAELFGIIQPSGLGLLETLVDTLRGRTVLLVLDNCEHLRDACAQLAVALLRACPYLQILATSRNLLGAPGERRFPLSPLELPSLDPLPPPEELAACDSVRFFVEHAAAAQPEFVLSEANAEPVARICAWLDGLPLALELAAARVPSLGVQVLADRLHKRFVLLQASGTSAPTHHRTLRAMVDWDYVMLPQSERVLWLRLAVFAGWFTLEDTEGTCGTPPSNPGSSPICWLGLPMPRWSRSILRASRYATACWRRSGSTPGNDWASTAIAQLFSAATPRTTSRL